MKLKRLVYLLAAIFAGLAACKNNDNVFAPKVSSFLNVLNASGDTLNFFVNGTRQNNTSSLYPGGQSFYLPVPAGTQGYQFKKINRSEVLFPQTLNLTDSLQYSYYAVGGSTTQSFSTQDILDTAGIGTKAKTRFVNASPDAGNIDVSLNDTLLFSALPFQSSSAFKVTGTGQKIIKVYTSGTTILLKADTVTFSSKYMYTLFALGSPKAAGSYSLQVSQAVNFQPQ